MQYVINADHSVEPMADPVEWHQRMQVDDIVVALDQVVGSTVATTFTGLAHGTSGGRPLVFETVVLKGPMDGRRWRWATYRDAQEGHKRTVLAVKVSEAQSPSSSADTST